MRSKRTIYNIITNLLLQMIVIVYGFIVPKIIISKFGSNVNGLISSITQFLLYISLLESGFGPVVKAALYKPIANKDKRTIENILKAAEHFFRTIAYLFIVYIVLLCLLYPTLVNKEFNALFTISLILIISISTFTEYFFGMTYKLYLQAEQRIYVISIIQIITYIFSTIAIILLSIRGVSIQIIKLVSGLIFILRPIIQNYYVKKKFNINLKNANKTYRLNQKWDGLAQHIAAVIHGNTDVMVLTIFRTLPEVSIYSIYNLVVTGIKTLIQAFSSGIDSLFGDMIAKNEIENMKRKFSIYETIYISGVTFLFTCCLILIVPFIKVYSIEITDINYVRYVFGFLIVLSEYAWAIRLPYSSITLAAGHFKETRRGAWVECILNIVLSIILVIKFGLVGVTIGTIVAMVIRTVEFIYHANKYILKRKARVTIKKIVVSISETLILVIILRKIPYYEYLSYIDWITQAIYVAFVTFVVVFGINFICQKNDFKELKQLFFKTKKQGV